MSFLHTKSFYYKIALITPIAVIIQMMLGSYVQGTGAGLSCPDWPTCQGQIVPAYNSLVYIEFIHRVFASFVSVLIILLLILTYLHRNETSEELGADQKPVRTEIGQKRLQLMWFVTMLLIIQVIFGGLTVILQLDPIVVMVHLGVATSILVCTMFIYFWVKPYPQ